MRNSKFIALLLALSLVLGSFGFAFADEDQPVTISAPAEEPADAAAPAEDEAASGDIVILHTNDVHCGYEAYDKLAELAKTADFVVDAGDAIQGGPIGTLSKGEYITEIMNKIGYDAAIPGNHEFDYKVDQIKKIMFDLATFPYVCCNLIDLKTGEPLLDAYTILEAKGKKVAFVGVATPETFYKSTPTYFQDENGNYIYSFCEGNDGKDLYDAVQKAVDSARAEGADYVIVLGHLGIDAESAPWRSTDVAANTKGIDAILDGHSHSVYSETAKNLEGKDVLIQQTGTKLANIGKITIAEDGAISGELVPTEDLSADAEMTAFIAGVTERFQTLISEVVAKTDVDLTALDADGNKIVRAQETNLGDLCADAYLNVMEADVAFANGGGVRANIPAGDITYEQILNVHPFGNMACLVEVSGQQILDALEMGYSQLPGYTGGFLQVAGLTCTVNTAIKSPVTRNDKGEFISIEGQRRVSDVMVGGEPIDPKGTYKLASHDYMLKQAGDGYTMFGKDNVKLLRDEVLIDNQVLINYIVGTLNGVVSEEYAEPQGRINIINDKTKVDVTSYFPDVNEGDWFAEHVQAAFGNGIIAGYNDGTYKPDNNLKHCEIMVMAARLHSACKGDGFEGYEVDGDHWCASFRDYLKKEGVIDDRFDGEKLEEEVKRGEMAYYFANILPEEAYKETGEFGLSDVAGDAYEAEIVKLVKSGIVSGFPDGTFRSGETLTRAQAASFVNNTLGTIDGMIVGE